MTRHAIIIIVLALTTLVAPRRAAALPVGLELELGTGIPFGAFPSSVPVSVDDAKGELFAKVPDSRYNVLLDARPTAGFSTALSLLLGTWYLRAAVTMLSYSSVTASRYAYRRLGGVDLPAAVHNIYVGKLDQEIELKESSSIVAARFGFGKRWYLLFEKKVRPFFLMGVGGVLCVLEGDARGGLTFHGGAGADLHLHQHFDLGLKIVYEWTGVFLPENFQASSAATAIGARASSENSVLSAFIESLHTIQIGVNAIYRF
jgi:hypothetical protein